MVTFLFSGDQLKQFPELSHSTGLFGSTTDNLRGILILNENKKRGGQTVTAQ